MQRALSTQLKYGFEGAAGVAGTPTAAEAGDAAATTAGRDLAESCLNSFTADTPVLMADGKEEPIADVKVGDKVLATDPETGRTEAKPVVALIRHSGKHTMVDLTLSDGSKITTTDHHPFWDATTGTFTDAINLHVGDQVLSDHGRTLTISGEHVYDRTLTAYNLQIDGIHTYYAGTTPVLVHNSCAAGGGASADNIAAGDAARVQQFADRTGSEVTVVGSRASGTAGPLSDWDYLVQGGWSHSLRSKGTWLLPRGPRVGGTGRDFLPGPLDPSLPWLTFSPGG